MWKKQGGKCPTCGDEINKESRWKIHEEDIGKKVILHPACHKKIHPDKIAVPAETL